MVLCLGFFAFGCTAVDMGVSAYSRGDYGEAASYLNQPARDGDSEAQFWLGEMWLFGRGTQGQSDVKAKYWFEQSARNGNAAAMYKVGMLYELGRGCEADIDKAVAWHTLAAQYGVRDSRIRLADLGADIPALPVAQNGSGDAAAALMLIGGIIGATNVPTRTHAPVYVPVKREDPSVVSCNTNVVGTAVLTNCSSN